MKYYFFILFLIFLCPFNNSLAKNFSQNASYLACFTPDQDCTGEIIDAINQAKQSILVQAYSFTSAPIAKALVTAQKRQVEVKIILDKSQFKVRGYSIAHFFVNHSIPVWFDAMPAIAHNKVMIIDGNTLITGSFNFTNAAQFKNTENLLIIHDPVLVQQYTQNWTKRQKISAPFADYQPQWKSFHHKNHRHCDCYPRRHN